MLYVEAMVLCLVFWLTCFLGTGTDVKNARSLSSYPSEAQDAVHGTKNNPELYRNPRKHLAAFARGTLLFTLVAVLDGWLLSLL